MRFPREWIGLALVVLGLARAALLVAHDPLVGYANQYDMIRTSACLGLFPDIAKPRRYEATPQAPLAAYRLENVRADLCYPSTEVAIANAVVFVAQTGDWMRGGMKLQWIGYAKLALLAFAALALAWSLHPHPNAALLHGLVLALVVCDPVVTLWFNTMYTEFSAIWGLYAAIGAICALAISGRAAYLLTAILALALVSLAFSREQFALLAPALVVTAGPWLWARSPHLAVSAFGVALVASIISFALTPRGDLVAKTNRVDAYLGILVPATGHPAEALGWLALPQRCESMVGATWYLRHGENLDEQCPEAYKLDSFAFLGIAQRQPEAIARAVARVLPAAQELGVDLGTLAGDRRVALNELPWWLRSPLHAVQWRIPTALYAWMVMATAMAAPLALLAAFAWARPSDEGSGAPLLLAMLLGGTALYSILTAVLGDGLSEAARHFLPGNLAIWSGLLALAVAIPASIARWSGAPRASALPFAASLAAVVAIAGGGTLAIRWAQAQPLALGVLETPTSRMVERGKPLPIFGWAIDPFGVEAVWVEVSGTRQRAQYGIPGGAVRRAFPGYPDADNAYFSLELPAETFANAAQQPTPVRILVRSRAGPTTEVDRRRIEVAP
ncbi:MAG TPA: hypothetical protein VLT89_08215 [Usitatibacter sp.]|nr:hypothetical protein [Usitatibacter sp.]